ncbi:MAG: hypothetical protein LQ346_000461 [Caloplaca aetnensis]|nr:MAG: hypothetical protein LQ346_000461 [Caloplaca aetnensis]
MAGKKAAGENTKKAAGNAKASPSMRSSFRTPADLAAQKAEAAAQKSAAENAKKAAADDTEWSKGAKSNAKKEEAEAKKAEAARKKAEKDAILAEEEKNAPSKPKNTKTAPKKTSAAPSRSLNLDQLDEPPNNTPLNALNATGIDNALDALSLTTGASNSEKVERHPERRFKAAYAAYEARRMPELEEEMKGLRRQQRVDVIRKEFEKSPENPFNQVRVAHDATKDEIRETREKEREKVEARLGK